MIVIILILRLLAPGSAVAFRETDTVDLTTAHAEANLAAAVAAGALEHVDPALLLSIAWHESRYQADAVTREPGAKWSCGVMTPEPKARCRSGSLLDGYRAGARHLRGWIAVTHSMRGALLGYTGGFALARACARGPVVVRLGVDACETPTVFLRRAAKIRAAIRKSLAHNIVQW